LGRLVFVLGLSVLGLSVLGLPVLGWLITGAVPLHFYAGTSTPWGDRPIGEVLVQGIQTVASILRLAHLLLTHVARL